MTLEKIIRIFIIGSEEPREFKGDGWAYKINHPDAPNCLKVFRLNETYIFPLTSVVGVYLQL